MIDVDKLFAEGIREALREGLKNLISSGYNSSPLTKIIDDSIQHHAGEFRTLLDEGLSDALASQEFKDSIKEQLRNILAKQLVQKFGGELERQVNALKSDPTTRARITLAINDIVKEKTS